MVQCGWRCSGAVLMEAPTDRKKICTLFEKPLGS